MARSLYLKLVRKLTLGALILLCISVAGVTQIRGSDEPRIVAMGDLHGDLPRLEQILQLSNLADARNRWTGGDSILLLTGDLLDRGKQVREVMDLVMALEIEAQKQGGRVITLFGNHEMMNIIGDLRYVTPEIYAGFADGKSEKRRKDAYKKYLKIRQRRAPEKGQPESVETALTEEEWLSARPLGFIEYREAISRQGKYGRWLRKLPAIVKIANTIFLHGGIHPALTKLEIDDLNDRIKNEVANFDFITDYLVRENVIESFFTFDEMRVSVGNRLGQVTTTGEESQNSGGDLGEKEAAEVELLRAILDMGSWLSIHPDGPLWFRGFGRWKEDEGTEKIVALLERYEADHFVVGHTITAERDVMQRFGGRVFLIDTVLPSALEIRGNQFIAIYPDGREEPKIADATVSEKVKTLQ